MQYICILHTIMIGKRIATAQERIIAVRISESHLEGKKKGFQRKQKSEERENCCFSSKKSVH